jgi:hypothetical protein
MGPCRQKQGLFLFFPLNKKIDPFGENVVIVSVR